MARKAGTVLHTATLPDGSTATRRSDHVYTHAVIAREDGVAKQAWRIREYEEMLRINADYMKRTGWTPSAFVEQPVAPDFWFAVSWHSSVALAEKATRTPAWPFHKDHRVIPIARVG